VGQPLVVVSAADRDEHDTPLGHPERRGRADAAIAGVYEAGLMDATEWRRAVEAPIDALERVHDPHYVAGVRAFCERGGGRLDPDTWAGPGSYATALRSAGAVLGAIDALEAGECEVAFAAVRPPGHHALADRAMGFCLFNNVAIGVGALRAKGHRVAIVDWDVHHGNGTQDIFYDDPDVLFVSTHEWPLYPGTGRLDETGGPCAPFTNLNLPFPPGTRGDTYRVAFDEVVVPVVERFAPDWILVSAGYDAHRDDPLAGLQLTSADFADLGRRVAGLVPSGRLALVLEGGYDFAALTHSTGATLGALVGVDYRPEAASTGGVGRPTVTAAAQRWGLA
jgi:acetoin utilization deacetylase AcuC-like enzyme